MVDSVKINFIRQMGDKMRTGMAANTQLLIQQKLRDIVFAFSELLIGWRDRHVTKVTTLDHISHSLIQQTFIVPLFYSRHCVRH